MALFLAFHSAQQISSGIIWVSSVCSDLLEQCDHQLCNWSMMSSDSAVCSPNFCSIFSHNCLTNLHLRKQRVRMSLLSQNGHFEGRLKPNCCRISGNGSIELSNLHMKIDSLSGILLLHINLLETIELEGCWSTSSAEYSWKAPFVVRHHTTLSLPWQSWGWDHKSYSFSSCMSAESTWLKSQPLSCKKSQTWMCGKGTCLFWPARGLEPIQLSCQNEALPSLNRPCRLSSTKSRTRNTCFQL